MEFVVSAKAGLPQNSVKSEPVAASDYPQHFEARLPVSWHGVLQMLNSPKSPFARFFNQLSNLSHISNLEVPASPGSNSAPLLPIDNPYGEVEQFVSTGCKSRRRGRELRRLHVKRWVNRIVALLDFYHLGSNSFKSLNTLAAAPLSNLQRDYCNIL